jgi:hypothetical protein
MFVHEGTEFIRKYGNRTEVFDGTCYCTSGKLTKKDLELRGSRIISKKRSKLGKERYKAKNPFNEAPRKSPLRAGAPLVL